MKQEAKTNQQVRIPEKPVEKPRPDTDTRIVNDWNQGHKPIRISINNK